MKPRVWLDMDPGIDDAWALLLAMNQSIIRGVSTVAGNASLENTYANARQLLEIAGGQDVPLIPGALGPLLTPLVRAEEFHGQGGLGEWSIPSEVIPPELPRVWSWWSIHSEELKSTHLIATGPLTNIAISLLAYPLLSNIWASVTCMGGALPGAQTDKAQEFNVYSDPHAADIVFHWGTRVQLIGINVAHKAVILLEDLDRLSGMGQVGHMLGKMLQFYSKRALGEGGNPEGFPVDDVVAVAAVVKPSIFQWREMPLAVVREGPLRGTVVLSPIDVRRPSVRVAVDVDIAAFRKWLWEAMDHYRSEPLKN